MTEPSRHILLITHDEAAAATILAGLDQLGYRVTRASTADEANECMAAELVDLIVMERLIPHFDTFRFVEQMMFNSQYHNVPLVYLAPQDIEIDNCRNRPDIEMVITRPINQLKLVAGVAALLERGTIFNHVMREDPLTRLLNRQSLEEEIERELGRVRRYQTVGTLVFLDLDNFKRVNDQFGHAVGDQTLRFTASVMKNNIRNIDIAGRFGGEEFVLYLPETAEAGAVTLANRLLDLCRTAADAPPGVTITFSAGVAEAPRDADTFASLAHCADQAMYRAKQTGKARVVVWHKEIDSLQKIRA